MKFTKLIAASFAALTMFSCSKEMTDVDQSTAVNPGEARVILNINKGGQTTYATGTEEQAIKSLIYGVYNDLGNLVTVVDNGGGTTSVDFTVSASDYAALTDKNVTLCILANSSTASAPASLGQFRTITEHNNPNDVATKGLVAYKEVTVNLSASMVTNISTVLERGAARFWVKAGGKKADGTTLNGRGDIDGARVEIYSVSTSVIPSTKVGSGTLAIANAYSYDITGATAPSNQFSNQEAAFYAYPTAAATATIKVTLGGESKEVTVTNAIIANKNYSITIIPKTVQNRQVVDMITIEAWNTEVGEDTGVDFNEDPSTTTFLEVSAIPGATDLENKVLLNAMTSGSSYDIDLSTFAFDEDGNIATDDWTTLDNITSVTAGTSTNNKYLQVTADLANDKIIVKAAPNYTSSSFSVPVTVSGKIGMKSYTSTFYVVLQALTAQEKAALDEGTVAMGTNKHMMLGTTGSAYEDLQNYIAVKNAGGFNHTTITANGYTGTDYESCIFFKGQTGKAYMTCPPGYKNPTIKEFCDDVFDGHARNYAGTAGGAKWANTLDVPEVLGASTVTKKMNSTAGGFTYFTVVRGNKTLYLFGSCGSFLNSDTWHDGSASGITPGNKVRIAPYDDGIAFNNVPPTTVGTSQTTRCIVDTNYAGGL